MSSIPASVQSALDERQVVYRKITRRLIPFLFLCYVTNYLDRVNIGFAKLQFLQDLNLSEAAYGFAAGLLFIGYVLFGVPSNLYLQKHGARATLLRLMVVWGVVSAITAFIKTPLQLYVARFLLGAVEAGFFPGIILYLTFWFPSSRRGRIISSFMMAIPIASFFGNPVSGWIMKHLADVYGLKGWQMLFLCEGFPAAILGVLAFFYLSDKPNDVKWLTPSEKELVLQDLETDRKLKKNPEGSLKHALLDFKVYIAGFVYIALFGGSVAMGLWTPTLIKGLGISDFAILGLISAIPFGAAAVGMYVIGSSSDRFLERRWHTAIASLVSGSCFLLMGPVAHHTALSVLLLAIAGACLYGAIVVFWAIPTAYLAGPAAAAGIALISSLGAISGFFVPTIIGTIKMRTGSLYIGLSFVGIMLIVGAAVLIIGIPANAVREKSSR